MTIIANTFAVVIDSLVESLSQGTTSAEDAQGTPTQGHISPSVLVYEDKKGWRFGKSTAHLDHVSGSNSENTKRESFIDNLLVRIRFIIVMIRWTSLTPWAFEFPVPGSFTSTFLMLSPHLMDVVMYLRKSVGGRN